MAELVSAIFATCIIAGSEPLDYNWDCVNMVNNCAVDKNGNINQAKVDECVLRFKKGERYVYK